MGLSYLHEHLYFDEFLNVLCWAHKDTFIFAVLILKCPTALLRLSLLCHVTDLKITILIVHPSVYLNPTGTVVWE